MSYNSREPPGGGQGQPYVKQGAGHADAMWRKGWAELRAAASYGPNSCEVGDTMGQASTLTPGEVFQQKQQDAYSPVVHEQEPQRISLDEMRGQAAQGAASGHDNQQQAHTHERGGRGR